MTEFKSELTKNTMKTAVAFANTKGGTIYIGIDDGGEVIGVENVDDISRCAVQLLADTIRPDITESSKVRQSKIAGADIVEIVVCEGSSKPYYLREKGLRSEGVYVRRGPASVPASEALLRKMLRESSTLSYESAVAVEQDLTFNTTAQIFADYEVEFGKQQMASLGFYKEGAYTNLAYLLSDQCAQGIKLAVFDDESKNKFLDREEIYGSVLGQAEKAYAFITKHNPLRAEIGSTGLKRLDYRAYPESAVREVLINALVHRDYSINGSILVSMMPDYLQVSSIGGLNPDIGYDDLLMGISSLRNPRLAGVFYRLKMIETYGTGIPRMLKAYQNNLLKPNIELSTNVFKVTLPMIETTAGYDEELGEVLELFNKQELLTRSEVEAALGISRSKAANLLSQLVTAGKIAVSGAGRNTKYQLR